MDVAPNDANRPGFGGAELQGSVERGNPRSLKLEKIIM